MGEGIERTDGGGAEKKKDISGSYIQNCLHLHYDQAFDDKKLLTFLYK